jgi:hypothetical protein
MILGPVMIWYGDVFCTKAYLILVLHGGLVQVGWRLAMVRPPDPADCYG